MISSYKFYFSHGNVNSEFFWHQLYLSKVVLPPLIEETKHYEGRVEKLVQCKNEYELDESYVLGKRKNHFEERKEVQLQGLRLECVTTNPLTHSVDY